MQASRHISILSAALTSRPPSCGQSPAPDSTSWRLCVPGPAVLTEGEKTRGHFNEPDRDPGEVERESKEKAEPLAVDGLLAVSIACSAFHDFQLITGFSCLAEPGFQPIRGKASAVMKTLCSTTAKRKPESNEGVG